MWAAIVLVGGLTLVAYEQLDMGGDARDQVVGDGEVPPGTGDSTTTTGDDPVVRPGPGQMFVTGTVTGVRLEGAVLDPREVPTPLTVISERGFGNGAEITGVLVDGEPSTIVWDGGRPFVLSSGGPLVLDPVDVDLLPDGLVLRMGGGAHALTPGQYRLDTPVAVGTSGIASPREGVTFEATASSLVEARGDAGIVFGPGTTPHLLGPGKVQLTGTFELRDEAGSRTESTIDVDLAAFDLTFRATAAGWEVEGIIDRSGGE